MDKKVLLSVSDLFVKFRVRGRTLTAIRGISLDVYENEAIAIVGESGSGKSVFTKTFAGMLDENGYISNGKIIFDDEELSKTNVALTSAVKNRIASIHARLNAAAKYELGADIYGKMTALENEKRSLGELNASEEESFKTEIDELLYKRTELYNLKLTLDPSKEKARIKELQTEIDGFDAEVKALETKKQELIKSKKAALKANTQYLGEFVSKMTALKADYAKAIAAKISDETVKRNLLIAKEIYLSVGRYGAIKRTQYINKLIAAFAKAMKIGADLNDEATVNGIFDNVIFRVKLIDEDETMLYGYAVLNLAKINYSKDWTQIRGRRIATVFQDPMTSLNPIITIGKQITSIILKHQNCTETEARLRAMELMKKVGIPNAEKRFDDYPFQYSGGMRQRIVIAIALSCQPKILICDEPTTALDVTIQAQILQLLKDLQKEFNYTIVFITHDLGVVANIADRVAVLYAGQVVELGRVDEVFYDPRHPYTWALLSSLPQLAQKNTKLYSITGTPPSLYNSIKGDPFAPRNPYCMKIDTLKEPPMFKVTDTHYAKTWLLDPRSPKVEKPEIIHDIHEKLMKAFNI